MINATDHRYMSEAVLVIVGLFAAAMLSWAISNRADWWRVRTELHGFSWFAATVFLFFAFNLFAFSYLHGSHALWFLLSFVAFGYFSFRIHEKFDSASSGAEGPDAQHSSILASMVRRGHRWIFGREGQQGSAAGIHLFQSRRRSPTLHKIIGPQCRVTGRGERRHDITEDLISDRLRLPLPAPAEQT